MHENDELRHTLLLAALLPPLPQLILLRVAADLEGEVDVLGGVGELAEADEGGRAVGQC